jgi:N-acetylmuramoyl-L-alanine amidase
MHYDKACNCTQGLLLADYVKAMITNKNLPGDLAQQAKSNKLLAQWAPNNGLGMTRPNDLPGSDLRNAFRRDGIVTIDAGHGGAEIGTSHTYPDGKVTAEKNLNLRVAIRLRELLAGAGYDVVMTRTTDSQVNVDKKDLTGDGQVGLSDDLQARVDIANRAGSDLFVSVHFNGTSNPNTKGTYMFWATDRPFSDKNKALAEMMQASMLKSLGEAGYKPKDNGARADSSVLGGGHYYLLGPKSDAIARPSEMPAIIGEPLFLTNDDDANAVKEDKIVEAVARGYFEGIKAYFAKYPPN